MSRPSTALSRSAVSRHPSPTTLASANAAQAASSISRETSLHDGALLVLSYERDNIFVLSSSSYEVCFSRGQITVITFIFGSTCLTLRSPTLVLCAAPGRNARICGWLCRRRSALVRHSCILPPIRGRPSPRVPKSSRYYSNAPLLLPNQVQPQSFPLSSHTALRRLLATPTPPAGQAARPSHTRRHGIPPTLQLHTPPRPRNPLRVPVGELRRGLWLTRASTLTRGRQRIPRQRITPTLTCTIFLPPRTRFRPPPTSRL
jgi:hypothetical protein